MIARTLIKNTKYWTGGVVGRHEPLYQFIPFSKQNQWKKVSPQKDICIEGFPRSANSFFSVAFRLQNPDAKCAHHMHAPMQIIKAAEYGVPIVVLIRAPIDAIASVLVVDQALSVRLAIQSYLNFYEAIWPLRDRFVISEFADTTQRPSQTVEKVNRLYGTSFRMEPISPEMKADIFEQLRSAQKELSLPENLVAVPTKAKAKVKQDVLRDLSAHPLLPSANALYQRFLEER